MIELVALYADDTLWHNEPFFTSVRDQFCAMLERYQPEGVTKLVSFSPISCTR